MSENTYIGLTIGPIVKTLSNARQSRELWGASYMFSYIMKQIINKWRKGERKREFVIPFTDDDDKEGIFISEINESNHFYGAGLTPDRFIFKQKKSNDLDDLKESVDEAIEEFVEKEFVVFEEAKNNDVSKDGFIAYLKSYLQISIVRKEIINTDNNSNPIDVINRLLDYKELQTNFIQKDETKWLSGPDGKSRSYNYLDFYLTMINFSPNKKELFKILEARKPFKSRDFPSIIDISTIELAYSKNGDIRSVINEVKKKEKEARAEERERNIEEEKNRKEEKDTKNKVAKFDFVTELKNDIRQKEIDENLEKGTLQKHFKFRNKYFCIVNADGDNIGKTIDKLKESEIKDLNFKLFEFAKKSVLEISEFGGKVIYVGGDDLLFFAPVVGINNKGTVFDLMDKLNGLFSDFLLDFAKKSNNEGKISPTLSFGISITYNKFPLYEALEISKNLLFENAKKYFNKNALSFKLVKHSGQEFEINISKHQKEAFKHFLEMTNRYLDDQKMFTSLMYKLSMYETILKEILSSKDSIDNFFENYFNEGVHKSNTGVAFIKDVARLLHLIYMETIKLKEEYINEQINEFYINKITQKALIVNISKAEKKSTVDAQLKNFYNILRTIHFIQQGDSNEQ